MTTPLFVIDPAHDDVPLNRDGLHPGWSLTLPASVRRHAIAAMRLTDGDELELSDGAGLRIRARLSDAQNGVAEVTGFNTEPQPVTRLKLVQALAKTGHDLAAVDMATQIGVDAVVPWRAARSIAKFKAGRTDEKWRQTLVAATEQSRRAWAPELGECASDKDVIAMCRRACVHGEMVIVLHQDATASWADVEANVAQMAGRCVEDGRPRAVAVVVGPEGGISEEEVETFVDAGAVSCVLGANILRASTAGPVALALLARALGRFA
ncbi:16S rRNA (uracil1498-N3)-methyltransferase [Bifidobacterium bohemicum]|uniref:Ribosomal RNA small subunit methyltransferase E n=1 Tax=Bifidobacterium bohemicum DSM 22767 TaxID=1437606 RepID=A0A086ZJQ7_9BIFI|nr:16S rRNA (uracil(1498)-N(3))-methyltransferase [Bifidobacterium bohemicum]KFI46757.1 RNA methyltransferase, RsmE family [Bifidobacterium bohemicum DSM 22767]SCB80683.1 16S rRNA (uracil1498-N3)-methyltransferase [Bifidobacterium bohemicum]